MRTQRGSNATITANSANNRLNIPPSGKTDPVALKPQRTLPVLLESSMVEKEAVLPPDEQWVSANDGEKCRRRFWAGRRQTAIALSRQPELFRNNRTDAGCAAMGAQPLDLWSPRPFFEESRGIFRVTKLSILLSGHRGRAEKHREYGSRAGHFLCPRPSQALSKRYCP
jgi:hypothetical protein